MSALENDLLDVEKKIADERSRNLGWCNENKNRILSLLQEIASDSIHECEKTRKNLLDQYLAERKIAEVPAYDSLLSRKIRGSQVYINNLKKKSKSGPLAFEHWVWACSMRKLFSKSLTKPEIAILLYAAYGLYEE